tara:strand:- start:1196 stop:1504 length:309 start_codon:yes stop_codon:yes gene_type:complete
MARPYSDKLLIHLSNADPERVGVQLAKLCVEAKLPATSIAEYFNVSRMAVHGWFRGKYIREKKCINIRKLMRKIQKDLDDGELPTKTQSLAKKYLEDIQNDY